MKLAPDAVWFITGCSTGFGRELARLALARGHRVAMTARGVDRVADLVALAPERALAIDLDVVEQAQIDAAVTAAIERFGRIDVLVNNAGYGYQTSVEEGVDNEIRAQFEANVFGLFALTRKILPVMRVRRSGAIVNISSVGGLMGFGSSGYYSATKHAVEGWSDSLKAEVGPLGIDVICVEPGPFRTDWAGRSLRQTRSRIDDYADTAAARMQLTNDRSGAQAGDPVRAAQAMIDAVERDQPPRHLVLGKYAWEMATTRLRERLAEIEALRDVAFGADFPDA